jgi:SOS-response transcriptional repressor LexA
MPPTYREIGAVMGITSTNGVHDHLAALHRKGYIELRHDGKARSIRLVRAAADTESVLNSDVLAADLLAEVERTLGVNLAGMSRVRMASAFRRILAGKVAA